MTLSEERLCDLRIRHLVHPDIDDSSARLDEGLRHQSRPADGCNENVRAAADLCEIWRSRVTHGYRCVTMQQQQRHRLADDVAAADDDGVTSGDRDALAIEQLDDA